MLLPRTAWLWPDLNVLGSYPAPDMCAQGSTVGRPRDTKILFTSFSIPAIVEIQHQVGTPLPLAAPQLNASPVTGGAPVPVQLLEALRCCSRSPHLAVQRAQVTSAASLPAPGQAAGAAWLLHESMRLSEGSQISPSPFQPLSLLVSMEAFCSNKGHTSTFPRCVCVFVVGGATNKHILLIPTSLPHFN